MNDFARDRLMLDGKRPGLLVSVRSLEEARSAVAGGADIVDIKEPANGSLGTASLETIERIADGLEGSLLLSVALGELVDQSPADVPRLPAAISLAKVGFAGLGRSVEAFERFAKWQDRFESANRACRLIAVAYADAQRCDAPAVEDMVALALRMDRPFLLVDTNVKDGRGYWSWLTLAEHQVLVHRCRQSGLGLAVAGSLQPDDVARFSDALPDVLAFRGAACERGRRDGAIDEAKVRELRTRIDQLWPTRSSIEGNC